MSRNLLGDLAGLIGGVADPWPSVLCELMGQTGGDVGLLTLVAPSPRILAAHGVSSEDLDATASVSDQLRVAGCRDSAARELFWHGRRLGAIGVGVRGTGTLSGEATTLLEQAAAILALGLAVEGHGSASDHNHAPRVDGSFAELERMATVGLVAAAVAHDLAAPIQGISMVGEELRTRVDDLERMLLDAAPHTRRALATIHGLSDDVRDDTLRARTLLNDFRIAAGMRRGETPTPSPVSLRDAVQSAIRLVTPMARNSTVIDVALDPDLPRVMGIRRRLDQVFTNLFMNAIQAASVRGPSGGRIQLRGKVHAGHAVIEVVDNGPGIAREHATKIFEPYFTTKPEGQGTGLGLHIVKEILEAHGGRIEVESEPGRGATFRVIMPAALGLSEAEKGHRPRVLVVEVDPAVSRAFERLLSREYDVSLSAGAAAAFTVLDKRGPRLDALIVDASLPEMPAPAFFDEVRSRYPGLEARIIFSSDGSHSREVDDFLRGIPNPCFEKPRAAVALGSLVRHILHHAA